ncbi:nuclease [Pseudomonas sp. FW306-02-F02-AA]|uniref:Nuclease n=1 Tax=Pseudomonas fluorescens TaxID=294 RepID=A0A0N9WID2_PSEFL|nr:MULTISPECIES: thermonuclease family protein [Pseudomonas]ALI01853.1 nuclease [Pseudomonas fluorescens]PMZ05331.1 nuclease [Pseudomonas sp. FW306-02-F02-AB]PMZ09236.1 nuclease [Pseudomonas sp. FW306-02-H06C]PMZ14948.1 nuclease [Pseudomonas sp. FW306-02-F02-AA]PMZ20135.1 nuclease [Pseudomonas sp. FW306-02-F08-AA]
MLESRLDFSRLMKKAPLAGAFFMSAIWLSSAQALCPAPASQLEAVSVQRVVDGDTVRLSDGRSVRMIGLNTPELGKKGRSDEPFAAAARTRLETLVAASDGRLGLLAGQEGKDRYGRTLAHLYSANGDNLEAQMLAEGLGYLVAVAPNVDFVSCQQTAERTARQARLGLWRQSPVLKAEQINQSGFAVLSGRVSKVQRNRGGIWIELQDSIVLRVAPNLLGQFDLAALERLNGKQIEARGWVIDRSRRGGLDFDEARWLLPLTHPAMLQAVP